jgi:glycosyltransferase involved in cell wall biosynthesis
LPAYRSWLREVVPYADQIFAVSKHSAQDLERRMTEWNRPIATPVVLPVGHRQPQRGTQPLAEPPFDRPFVLFVSTIEVRKNHMLLFRVWRMLLQTLPVEQVPYLVFAGKIAWLTGDLLVQLENANWLEGHIKLVEAPAEPELAGLYEHCAFTVFPSLYEGWGLPVTESLGFGKTVAASNRAAIPEAGGDFCCYFDPENVGDAYAVIRGMIENPERVRTLERRIAEDFHPPSWADTAAALLSHLQENAPAAIRAAA